MITIKDKTRAKKEEDIRPFNEYSEFMLLII